MNEQVRNILAQSTTKTSKIQQLLQLGLTRRQVADLVTNGNYGFVQNVYKKMLDRAALAAQQVTTEVPQIDYTFTRRFGVEIEAYNCTRERLARELRDAGINVAVEGYNHNTRNHWKLVTDASLSGNNTFELVSPILEGESGLRELEKVCWVLDLCDVKVNDSCGLHIHMEAADFTMTTWQNLAITYKNIEPIINAFMPGSRRNNRFCKSLSHISDSSILEAVTIDELRGAFGHDRYHKVNLEAYARHRTVEFRQHGGSTNFTKMKNWILFLNRMITFAQHAKVASGTALQNLPFLEEDQKTYFKLRTKKLSR
ncbi:amidoligase family protein [Phocaeicola sartorii]|uniref:amidoligase family protein n=1 Tax=Phocaeicola sartorii TaxID=671267 RepID=UPI003514C852